MLTRTTLPFRNLCHFGAANLLTVVGVIVGTAVLTGALLLGDSLKGSLADLSIDRLGGISAALMSERFFPASLAERMAKESSREQELVPAVILRGTVLRRNEDGSTVLSRAGQVQIVGVDASFWKLFGESRGESPSDGVLINQALADALQPGPADRLEVRVEKPQRVPPETVLGRRSNDPALVIESSPVAVVLPNRGAGRFTLLPRQETPLILYVQLERLQRRLTRDQQLPAGSVNVLLANTQDGSASRLQEALDRTATLEDLGFTLRKSPDNTTFVLETSRMLLESTTLQAVKHKLADQPRFSVTPVLTYLANRTYRADQVANGHPPKSFVPYSAITGLATVNGIALNKDEVVIDDFVARDLWPAKDWQAFVGKPVIRIEYFVESEGHILREATHDLKLKAVVPVQGDAADETLTPAMPGMKTKRIADWNPPFPRQQWHPEWVRPRDEEFYLNHQATPKLFVHPATAAKLFASRFGNSTSLRIRAASGTLTPADEQAIQDSLKTALRPREFGLVWQPVKAQGLQAAMQGPTTNMFGGLFAGFSLFLIVAAALLVGLLFRLRSERRARELGLLLATGWPIAKVRRMLLVEGAILALGGALLGLPAALGYAWLMIRGLRSGWGGMLASDFLTLHVGASSLATGACISVLIALIAILWSLRGLVRQPVPVLLAGRTVTFTSFSRRRSAALWVPALTGVLTLGLIGFGVSLPAAQQPGPFFGAGFLSLLTLLLVVRFVLRRRAERGQSLVEHRTLWQFGRLNTARSPGRSLLTLSLLAAGCFLVLAVGAFRKGTVDPADPHSGTGGFTLLAESDLPLRSVPQTELEWTTLLGEVSPEQRRLVQQLAATMRWYGFRLSTGEDVSCLNLYQPTKPRVLGVPESFAKPGQGFRAAVWERMDNHSADPWGALFKTAPPDQPHASGMVLLPVVLDDHTAQWVLQKQLGDSLDLVAENGEHHEGRLVAMLQGSIFQSEILVREQHFRDLYPSEAGYRFFLISAPLGQETVVRSALETLLGDSHGLIVRSTADRLAAFHAVENTYIGTFQALGGLGLLLGTAGLAIVILRNVQERQPELALLLAVGFSRRHVAITLLSEVAWLVGTGVLIGCLSALLVVAPMLTVNTAGQLLKWFLLILLLVPIVAVFSSLAGIRLALRTPLIPALRGD